MGCLFFLSPKANETARYAQFPNDLRMASALVLRPQWRC